MDTKKGDGFAKLAALGAFYKSTGGDIIVDDTPQGLSVTFVPGLQGDIDNLDISAIRDAVFVDDESLNTTTPATPAP